MQTLPRILVPLLRTALALSFVGFTAVQLVAVPAITIHDLDSFDWSAKELAFALPLALIFIGLMGCLQVIIVCTWRLLTLVTRDEIFNAAANSRWVDRMVRAGYVAWCLLAGLAPYCFLIAFKGDAPGALLMGFMLGLVATCALGVMVVLRALLRSATALRQDLDEVI